MYKSPESYSGNPEKTREEARDTGKKVLSAAEVAEQQKQREDYLKQMMQDLAAKRAAEKAEAAKNAASSASETLSPSAGEAAKKAKGNSAFKRALFGVLLGGGIALGAFAGYQANKQPAQTPTTAEATAEDTDTLDNSENQETASPFAGELANGVHYDYYEYADIENKTSKNAYGYNKSEAYGDREATENAWMDMADKGPEYLASYATHVFTDEEKQSLGIADMSCSQLDDYLSDAENIDGGEKQRNIMAALDAVARDKENTFYEFYHEEGEEKTYYITFEDLNNDGTYSPDELKLAYTTKKRNGAPQVDIYRLIKGGKVKVLDLNMECGMQPNEEQPPLDLPPIPSEDDNSTGSEGTGSEGTGSEGTGSEGTGSEGTGSEGTGSEGTGSEGTPSITPKDPENMTRIDTQIQSDIANDIGSEQVIVHQPSAEPQPVTPQPQSNNQTAPATVQNESAPAATPAQPSAPANVVSENKAPANEQVQNVAPNTAAQEQADSAKIEVVEPTDDELAAFGIN